MYINNYNDKYRIVSLVFDETAKEDLLEDRIDFLFIKEDSIILYPLKISLDMDQRDFEKIIDRNNFDVYEIWPDGAMNLLYDACSLENHFFITGKCNSNCIMCPSPDISRRKGESSSVERLIELAKHIPVSAPHLTVTGGEPFLIGKGIFEFIQYLKEKYLLTSFLFLTNGRIFAMQSYVDLFQSTAPYNTIVGIPIHGSCAEVHDEITRSDKSFAQTSIGIKKLLRAGFKVELRIVVCKLNLDDLCNIAELIVNEFSDVDYVSIIAMETTGNAFKNRDLVWIPYKKSFPAVENAIEILIKGGVDVKLYNFPLCTVPNKYWTLCEKSISPDKVKYEEFCQECKYQHSCGGVFVGTYLLEKNELRIIE